MKIHHTSLENPRFIYFRNAELTGHGGTARGDFGLAAEGYGVQASRPVRIRSDGGAYRRVAPKDLQGKCDPRVGLSAEEGEIGEALEIIRRNILRG
ncbi:hypothetical protein CASFOL_018832 [Castilleja foliolosa]|uniref:Chorismate synthase n=1 Tax=Castilleja foliolosa TaxID=1961234 RepID=A0ABD3D2R0_9LAMI